MKTLTIATRKSPLALWQAEHIAHRLRQLHPKLEIKLLPLVTTGDIAGPEKWQQDNGKGMFVKELEEALLNGKASLAVHSMKDVPATFPEGLGLGAICERADPFDAFVSDKYASLSALPKGAKVGTASLRRQAQLLNYRPDLQVEAVRGNVQTRLKKMKATPFDAIILAASGLMRLGYDDLIKETLMPPVMLPACGQGALGIECRENDLDLLALLKPLHCEKTTRCVQTERAVNAKLGGNCHTPIALFCTEKENHLQMQARVLSADGKQCIAVKKQAPLEQAHQLAEQTAQALIAEGAESLL